MNPPDRRPRPGRPQGMSSLRGTGGPNPQRNWPECVRHLPVCTRRRLPVPYSSGVDAQGVGRWGRNDPIAKLACAVARRCGVCGDPFDPGEDLVWLVEDRPMTKPVFPDPPNHERCAEAALRLCPRIANPRLSPAAAWMMWIAADYDLVPGRRAIADFRPGPLIRRRRFAYRAGTLQEVN